MAKKKTSFEASMQELQQILENMSGGELALDDMVEQYARAAKLMQECKTSLDQAELRIREIDASVSGMEDEDDL